MSNLARKQQQYVEPKRMIEPQIEPLHKRKSVTLGEKLLAALLVAFVCIMAVKIISTQAAIYKVNTDIQNVQSDIKDQKKVNGDLEMQVSDLSRYDRVKKKAEELGLKLNENNVKVVEDK